MRRKRIVIAGSIGAAAQAALGLMAVLYPTRLVANGLVSLALVLCAAAAIGAFARPGRARGFSGGFAIVGGGYLLLSLGPWFEVTVGPHLITTSLIDLAFARPTTPWRHFRNVFRRSSERDLKVAPGEFWRGTEGEAPPRAGWDRFGYVPSVPYPLLRGCHALIGTAAGLAGGLLGWSASGRGEAR